MLKLASTYVRVVDRFNYVVGRVMMYSLFLMIAILLWSTISKAAFVVPAHWTLEMAQFALVAYYLVGGAYSIQLGSNVRMDLFYGEWSVRKKAWFDRRSPTLWRPPMWPVKAVMCFGIFLMLLQAISELIKDIATIKDIAVIKRSDP